MKLNKWWAEGLFILSIPLIIASNCKSDNDTDPDPEPPVQQEEFHVYQAWDFENKTPGPYADADIRKDFSCTVLYSHKRADIVPDIINNVPTKVFRVTHPANDLGDGFEMNVDLGHDYDELYLSYNIKFSNEFNSTAGGKLPGLGGLPDFSAICPSGGMGFRCHNMFKQAGSIISYHYDRTTGKCPWALSAYKYHPVYFNNGVWYNITQRVVMNTFTSGVANANGIKELWVDGLLVFQEANLKLMERESDTMKVDAFRLANFYGGQGEEYMSLRECYVFFDNFKVYTPVHDPVSGQKLHTANAVLDTPDEITDRRVYYDVLKETAGPLQNADYGITYGGCLDETWLIDAGDGNTVSLSLSQLALKDGGDYLFFYDGNLSNSKLLKMIKGPYAALPGMIRSSGRYLFVRFSSDRLGGDKGWSGSCSFEKK